MHSTIHPDFSHRDYLRIHDYVGFKNPGLLVYKQSDVDRGNFSVLRIQGHWNIIYIHDHVTTGNRATNRFYQYRYPFTYIGSPRYGKTSCISRPRSSQCWSRSQWLSKGNSTSCTFSKEKHIYNFATWQNFARTGSGRRRSRRRRSFSSRLP